MTDWKKIFKERNLTPEQAMAFLEMKAAEGNPKAIAALKRIRERQKANASTEKGIDSH